ncbi:MAG: hypothetical protein CV045_13255 [Cyanobacteria bacterium M5B4]|nr:MAG: hypothetical protein CV045_13255 [Cyanobacteria bacterium M5B4]
MISALLRVKQKSDRFRGVVATGVIVSAVSSGCSTGTWDASLCSFIGSLVTFTTDEVSSGGDVILGMSDGVFSGFSTGSLTLILTVVSQSVASSPKTLE